MSATVRGIDVSHHNGRIDWRAVAASGVRFVWCKATEGPGYVDPTFKANVDGARAAGLAVGAYHFGHPNASPDDQAHHFRQVAGALELAPVLDLEVTDGRAAADVHRWAERFVSVATAAFGRRLVLYSGAAFWNAELAGDDFGCWRWVARYNVSPPRGPWDVWQHTSGASIPGIGGRVDENVTTEAVLAELCGTGAPTTAPDPQPQVVVEGDTRMYLFCVDDKPGEVYCHEGVDPEGRPLVRGPIPDGLVTKLSGRLGLPIRVGTLEFLWLCRTPAKAWA